MRGSLDNTWEDEETLGRVDVDRSLSEDLELWCRRSEEEERAGRVLLL